LTGLGKRGLINGNPGRKEGMSGDGKQNVTDLIVQFRQIVQMTRLTEGFAVESQLFLTPLKVHPLDKPRQPICQPIHFASFPCGIFLFVILNRAFPRDRKNVSGNAHRHGDNRSYD
jgi:hypothetical protein